LSRRILLLDITAMTGDFVCVAGIDLGSGETVRLNDPQPTRQMIARWNLRTGDIIRVDCKPLRPLRAPHVEDYKWNERSLRREDAMPFAEMRDLVAKTALPSINEAFGPAAWKGAGGNSAWNPSSGQRSLATLVVCYARVDRDPRGKVRVALRDDKEAFFGAIPFQDLVVRTHESGCGECRDDEYLARIKSEFEANRCIVRVGLTRPFVAQREAAPGCWLQLTNILARPRTHF